MPLTAYERVSTLTPEWTVEFGEEFDSEFLKLAEEVRVELSAQAKKLERFGPTLGRPTVDTLNASKHKNMKELRFETGGGVWRVAFAFDPRQRAILLVAGDKSGGRSRTLYTRLIKAADSRYDDQLARVKAQKEVIRR